MNKMISIIVPVYNVEKYLSRCIDSLLNQTYTNFELILINDCSKDNSLAICKKYEEIDSRIIVIDNKKQSGVSASRNAGIERASGEYVMFADSDDYVCNDFVEKMVNAIEEKNVDIVRCKAIIYKKDGGMYVENIHGREGKTFENEELKQFVTELVAYNQRHIVSFSMVLIIRGDKIKIKYNEELNYKEDLVFFIQLLLENVESIYFLDEALYYYCYNEKSLTKNCNNFYNYIRNSIVCGKIVKELLNKHDLLNPKLEKDIDYTLVKDDIQRFYLIKDYPVLEIRKEIREAFENDELNKMIKNIDIKTLTVKAKFLCVFLKVHAYLLISIYIKKNCK